MRLNEFSPTIGQATSRFASATGDILARSLSNMVKQDPKIQKAVDSLYQRYVSDFRSALKGNEKMRGAVDVFTNTWIKKNFRGTSQQMLTKVDKNKLVKQGKLNTPYIKSLFLQAIKMTKPGDTSVGVGTDPSQK